MSVDGVYICLLTVCICLCIREVMEAIFFCAKVFVCVYSRGVGGEGSRERGCKAYESEDREWKSACMHSRACSFIIYIYIYIYIYI
jgi:hypothetical protein